MGRLMGIEPTNAGTTIRCVNHFATIAMCFFGRGSRNRTHTKGFGDLRSTVKLCPYIDRSILEPSSRKQMVEGGRFELPNPKERIYSPPRLATSLPLHQWWLRTESNRRHMDFQSIALPTELLSHKRSLLHIKKINGGPDGTRTRDLLRDRQAF